MKRILHHWQEHFLRRTALQGPDREADELHRVRLKGWVTLSLLVLALCAARGLSSPPPTARPAAQALLEAPDFGQFRNRHAGDKEDLWETRRSARDRASDTPMHLGAVSRVSELANAMHEGRPTAQVEALREGIIRDLGATEQSLPANDRRRERLTALRGYLAVPANADEAARQRVGIEFMFGEAADPRCARWFHDASSDVTMATYQLVSKHAFSVARTWVVARSMEKVCPPLEGRTVADIGTGVGALLPFLVAAVGPSGTVWAEDIEPDVIDFIRFAGERGIDPLRRVRPVLGTADDTRLPPESVDVAFVMSVDVLRVDEKGPHERDDVKAALGLLGAVRRALKPGGSIVVVLNCHRNAHRDNLAWLLEEAGFSVEASDRARSGVYVQMRARR